MLSHSRTFAPLPRRGLGLPARLHGAFTLWRHRRHLETLDARMLEDVGLTEVDVARDAALPAWDIPAWWR